jgi:glutathione S-transferase
VTAWQRLAERNGFYAVMEAFRNATPGLKGRAMPGPDDYEQIPALAERGRARVAQFFKLMDARLADNEYVAGTRYTIADITTLVAVDFAAWAKLGIPAECPRLRRWHAAVSARPSAKA